jgi:hypothetical protein
MSEPASQLERRLVIMTEVRARRRSWMVGAVLALSVACVAVAAQIEPPVVPNSATSADGESASPMKSPAPDLLSDKAFGASVAKSRREVMVLAAHPSPENLAAAAWLAKFMAPAKSVGVERSLELIERAEALAPERPELVWIHISICRVQPCGKIGEVEEHLKALDPNNGFVWLPYLAASTKAGSESGITEAIVRIGASSSLTTYWTQRVVMMADALSVAEPTAGLSERGIGAIGIAAAMPWYPLQLMSKACHVEQFIQPGRRAACEALMARMEQSDTILTQSFALSVQARWWPAGSQQLGVLKAKHRRLDYVMLTSSRLRLFRMNHDMALRIDAARKYEREEDVDLVLVKSFGLPAVPALDWKDTLHSG